MSSKPLACCLLVSSERAREGVEHPMTEGEKMLQDGRDVYFWW